MSTLLGPAPHLAHLITDLKTRTRESALGELARRAQSVGAVRGAEALRATLLLRERLGSTAVGRGVAVPNARSLLVTRPVLLVGRAPRGLEWGAPDGEPVRVLLLVLSPAEATAAGHVAAVARAALAARPARARQRLLECGDPGELAGLLAAVAT
jgi:mannitol/fructose-specific phosphotransferase system IIA component (Ntr-type)